MASFLFRRAMEEIARTAVAWENAREWRWMSVKRRTWRTLWLVPRTFRVKVPLVRVALSTSNPTEEYLDAYSDGFHDARAMAEPGEDYPGA